MADLEAKEAMEQDEGFHHFLPPFLFEAILGGRYKVVEKQDEGLLPSVYEIQRSWTGLSWETCERLQNYIAEILAKAKTDGQGGKCEKRTT